jgi:hypothetical protein
VIVANTRQPLVDGARAMLDRGFDPTTPLTMRMAAKPIDRFLARPSVQALDTVSYEPARAGTIPAGPAAVSGPPGQNSLQRRPSVHGTTGRPPGRCAMTGRAQATLDLEAEWPTRWRELARLIERRAASCSQVT